MQHLLITGGSGYLGRALVQQAAESGRWTVTATYAAHPRAAPGVEFVPLDVRDRAAVQRVLQKTCPHVVIHTAYVQREPDLWQTTAAGAQHVAQAAQAVGARLIHISSDALFDGERTGVYTEADLPSPITPYGEAKAAAERLVAAAHPAALIVRTSLIYGGTPPSSHEELVLNALDQAQEIAFFTDEIRNPIHVADLAAALLELAPTEAQGVLHVAGADAVSRYTFACLIAQHHGRAADQLRAGRSASSGMRRPRNVALDSARAQALLQTRLRGMHEVLGA